MANQDATRSLRQAYKEFVDLIHSLPEALFLSSMNGWSPRDVVAHLIGWNGHMISFGVYSQRRAAYVLRGRPQRLQQHQRRLRRDALSRGSRISSASSSHLWMGLIIYPGSIPMNDRRPRSQPLQRASGPVRGIIESLTRDTVSYPPDQRLAW
jgi:hypothetical protein